MSTIAQKLEILCKVWYNITSKNPKIWTYKSLTTRRTIMNVQDLVELVGNYNAKKNEIFDQCAEKFLTATRDAMQSVYNNGGWAELVEVDQFGISVRKISKNFQTFELDVTGYPKRHGETLSETIELKTMKEFFDAEEFDGKEINGFQDNDIILLKPFCEALERKGLESYAAPDNCQIVVAFTLQ